MEFLTGKDYPWVCEKCCAAIDAAALLFNGDQPDTDDEEAPAMYVYDHKMYCGGHSCKQTQNDEPAYFVEKLHIPHIAPSGEQQSWGVYEFEHGVLVHALVTEQEAVEMCETMNDPDFVAELEKEFPELAEM